MYNIIPTNTAPAKTPILLGAWSKTSIINSINNSILVYLFVTYVCLVELDYVL